MSANIAVIYSGAGLREVAQVFGEAATHLSATARLLRVPGESDAGGTGEDRDASLEDVIWADGIAFGTPIAPGTPSPALIALVHQAEQRWSGAELGDKVVSIFTDEPERFAPDAVVHPIYDALYQWGAVIVGPRASELALDAQPHRDDPIDPKGTLSPPRWRTSYYRARRLIALAGLLAAERARRGRLEL